MRENKRPHRLLALSALVLFSGQLPGMTTSGAQEEVREVFQARWTDDDRTPEAVADELAAIGAEAIPVLIGLVDGTAMPALIGLTEEGEELDVSDWWRGPDAFGPVAFEALGRLPASDVISYLAAHNDQATPLEARLLATRILGRLGCSEGIGLLCELSSYCTDYELQYRSVRGPFERAFASVLTEDRHSVEELQRRLDDLQYDAQTIVIDAIKASERPESFSLLETLVAGDYGLDLRILSAVADLGDRYRWRLDDEPAELLQLYLFEDDPDLRRAAAAALERLQAASSCRVLITLLQDDSPAVRRTSLWALQRLSRTPLEEKTEQWHVWLDEQEAWWQLESARLTAQLQSGEPAEVLNVVRKFSERPFFRHEIALLLADTLHRTRTDVSVVLCDTLGRLGSRAAVPKLAEQLYDSNEEVRQAAWQALCKLTGKDLPLDAQVWSDYVNG